MNSRTDAIINEIEKVIIGKRNVVERVLMAILSEGHILLDDVPGTGKTTLALTCSVVMGVQYQRMQFTPDVVPSDIVGFSVYNKATGGFDYKPGVVMTNLLLADEINRTSSKTQSALLEVMEEGQVTVDGVTHQLPKPFVVIATQNPVGSAGNTGCCRRLSWTRIRDPSADGISGFQESGGNPQRQTESKSAGSYQQSDLRGRYHCHAAGSA